VPPPLADHYRAVVFDMDGLLLDTEALWHGAEVELFHRHGGEFTWEDKMAVIGTSFDTAPGRRRALRSCGR
jgi:beta-phosphoglucomutase-like phosphatase (HAD superfamily)